MTIIIPPLALLTSLLSVCGWQAFRAEMRARRKGRAAAMARHPVSAGGAK